MPNLIKKIQNTCFQNNLFKKGDRIILAVSGGPDSVCLLDVFSKLQKKYSLDLIIAHVNYGLRKYDSLTDEKFVRRLAEKYGMKIEVLALFNSSAASRHIPSIKKRKKTISENSLRKIRYNFFEKLRSENNFDAIAVAHNLDDQVETFLMRIIRGAGMSGLTAMKFKNNFIIRPLLSMPRQEILEYLKANKLKFRTDKTNLENNFFRNKIRNKLIPILKNNFNPKINQTIFNSLVSISEDLALLDEIAEKTFNRLDDLNVEKLKKIQPAILRRILRKTLEKERKNLKNVEASHIEEIIKIIKSTKNKTQIVILPGLKITRKGDKLTIVKN